MIATGREARRRQRVTEALRDAWREMEVGCVVDELFREVAADVVRRNEGSEGLLSSCSSVAISAPPELGELVEVRAQMIAVELGQRRLRLEARSVSPGAASAGRSAIVSAVGTVVLPCAARCDAQPGCSTW